MSDFELKFTGDEKALGDPELLKALCQKEVASFEAYVKASDPWFSDGLVKVERLAIAGYLYQKAKGRLDVQSGESDIPMEGKDGA